jgi:hypothetical protein
MVKKSHLRQFSFILLMSVSLLSCTIQKRSFNRGYYVEWKTKLQNQPQNNLENEVLLSSSKRIVISDSSTKNHLFATDIDPLIDNDVFSEKIKIQDFKENILQSENEDTLEMFTYKYRNKTIIASKKDIQKLEKKKITFSILSILGLLLLIVSVGVLFIGANSVDIGAAVVGVLFGIGGGIFSLIILFAGLVSFLYYKELLKKMITKNNAILEGTPIESTSETDQQIVPNPHSKRNFLIFVVLIFTSVIGYIAFKNF